MGSYLILIEVLLLTLRVVLTLIWYRRCSATTSCILKVKITDLIRLYNVPKPTLRAYLLSSILAVDKPHSQKTTPRDLPNEQNGHPGPLASGLISPPLHCSELRLSYNIYLQSLPSQFSLYSLTRVFLK